LKRKLKTGTDTCLEHDNKKEEKQGQTPVLEEKQGQTPVLNKTIKKGTYSFSLQFLLEKKKN